MRKVVSVVATYLCGWGWSGSDKFTSFKLRLLIEVAVTWPCRSRHGAFDIQYYWIRVRSALEANICAEAPERGQPNTKCRGCLTAAVDMGVHGYPRPRATRKLSLDGTKVDQDLLREIVRARSYAILRIAVRSCAGKWGT